MAKGAVKYKNMTLPKQQGELCRLRALGGPDFGHVFVVTANRVTIGRGEENDILLTDPKASRKHVEISMGPMGAQIKDLGSAHGVMVNGIPQKQLQLRSGDKIGLGESVLEFIGAETGATRMIVAPPAKAVANVGTGGSGMTQFIPRPASQQAKTATTANAFGGSGGSFLERNKKLLILLGGLMAIAGLLPEVEQKQKAKKNKYVEPKDLEADRGLAMSGLQVDEKTKQQAETYFREGFREYQSGNYLRAQTMFETALQIWSEHALSRIYIQSTKKAMEDEAKLHFEVAKKDEEANRVQQAFQRYDSVKRLFSKDQSNPLYKQADARAEELKKRVKENEK